MNPPTICFGQQPSGFFPKRFLVAKINTARKLQQEIGGKIIFFYHDSDADYRETITLLKDKQSGVDVRLNFLQENKIQKKFSPLYAKKIPAGWKEETLKQLPRFVDQKLIDIFKLTDKNNVADFCLEMYKRMGLLNGIEVVRSGDKTFREKATNLDKDYFADVQYQGEIVRAQLIDGKLMLHEGGGKYITLPDQKIEKWQKNPDRDARFAWMQSVVHCTHYVAGKSEQEYLAEQNFKDVTFVDREEILEPNYALINF